MAWIKHFLFVFAANEGYKHSIANTQWWNKCQCNLWH